MKYIAFAFLALLSLTLSSNLRTTTRSEAVNTFFSFLEETKVNDKTNIKATIKLLLESGSSYDEVDKLLKEVAQHLANELAELTRLFEEDRDTTTEGIENAKNKIETLQADIKEYNRLITDLTTKLQKNNAELASKKNLRDEQILFITELKENRRIEHEKYVKDLDVNSKVQDVLVQIKQELVEYQNTGIKPPSFAQLKEKSKVLSPLLALVQLSSKFDPAEYQDLIDKIEELIQAFTEEISDLNENEENNKKVYEETLKKAEDYLKELNDRIAELNIIISQLNTDLAAAKANLATAKANLATQQALKSKLEAHLKKITDEYNIAKALKEEEITTVAEVQKIFQAKKEKIQKYENLVDQQ